MFDPADDTAVSHAYETTHPDEPELIACPCGRDAVTTRLGYWSDRRIPVCFDCDQHWEDICLRVAFFDAKQEKGAA